MSSARKSRDSCVGLVSGSRRRSMDPYADLQEKMRRKEELLREREDKILANCSFEPTINTNAAVLAARFKKHQDAAPSDSKKSKSPPEASFKPQLSTGSVKIVSKHERGDVVERLLEAGKATQDKTLAVKAQMMLQQKLEVRDGPHISSVSKQLAAKLLEDNHDNRPLVDRLYDKQREHNALVARLKEEKDAAELAEATFKPTVSTMSSELAMRHSMSAPIEDRLLMKTPTKSSSSAPPAATPGSSRSPARDAAAAKTPSSSSRRPLTARPSTSTVAANSSGEVERLKALLAQKDEIIVSMRAEIDGLRLALEVKKATVVKDSPLKSR